MALYVQETGTSGAQPILFLHPGLVSGWMWQEPAQEFADYHCLIPDLPGHGNSNQVEWVSFQDTANQVADIIKKRAPGKRAHVVGISLGACVTAQLLGIAPEIIDHAIICSAPARPLPKSAEFTNRLVLRFANSAFLWQGLARMWGIPDGEREEFVRIGCSLSQESYSRITSQVADFRLPAGLKDARCPTLVVAGQKEQKVILQSVGDFLAALPNAQGCLAPKGDHYWGFRNPELFVKMTRAWITDEPLPQELIPVQR